MLCDRILVLFEGQIVGTFDADLEARNRIGLAMSGLGAFPEQDTLQTQMEFSECN